MVVREPPKRNSGIIGGNFLSRMKVCIAVVVVRFMKFGQKSRISRMHWAPPASVEWLLSISLGRPGAGWCQRRGA